jgi:hypothetical protein
LRRPSEVAAESGHKAQPTLPISRIQPFPALQTPGEGAQPSAVRILPVMTGYIRTAHLILVLPWLM